jgi:AraC-like DNA-binding protein
LKSHHIISVGVSTAGPGFMFSRTAGIGVVMGCTAGAGIAWTGEHFVDFGPGHVYRMPSGTRQVYAARTTPWRVTWICYLESPARPHAVPGPLAVHRGDAAGLETLVLAVLGEVEGAADPAMLGHYAALIDLHARRLTTPVVPDPLRPVWDAVEADLARPWRLADLARLAGMGVETLRLSCLASTRRSPMQHLTHLRMQNAALQLTASDASVGEIAARCGYDNAFAATAAATSRCCEPKGRRYDISCTMAMAMRSSRRYGSPVLASVVSVNCPVLALLRSSMLSTWPSPLIAKLSGDHPSRCGPLIVALRASMCRMPAPSRKAVAR